MADYLTAPATEIGGFLHRAAHAYAHQQNDEWLNTIINALNVDYSAEFALTPESLELYSKEQLQKLAKEAKIRAFTKGELAKKQTLITAILTRTPSGFVPKDFARRATERSSRSP
jgi:hypothetical protein